jgi:predicted N-acetyltransferase YhbS
MKISNLKTVPHLYPATLKLIEESFHYQTDFSFAVDFAPLTTTGNWENCWIIHDEDRVFAHIGVCKRKLHSIPIAMMGGIAVAKEHRGKGYFQKLIQDVLAEYLNDVACFILWSDQEKLYQKYGFHLCGTQMELSQQNEIKGFECTRYSQLLPREQQQIKNLYQTSFQETYYTLERNDSDWDNIKDITSAQLFLQRKNGDITGYFFKDKGQDLTQIIYEYGSHEPLSTFLPQIASYGKVWGACKLELNQQQHYQFAMACADIKLFTLLITKLTAGKFIIKDVNIIKQEVYFFYNEELLALEMEEFLRGVIGPGRFEELGEDIKPLFISGLDSI